MKIIEHALLRTIIYADIFKYALTSAQLWRFLIRTTPQFTSFNQALQALERKKIITKIEDWYVLKKRHELVTLRKEREKIARVKMRYAYTYARLLRLIPWVWYVGVSGALAMHNAPHDDDIDFFIITAPNRLWLSRFLCVLVLDVVGVRRTPGAKNFKNRICLNMFINGAMLRLSKSEHDLYSAHEIVQLKTLNNKHHTYERFIAANDWVERFLPQAVTVHRYKPFRMQKNFLFDSLEKITKLLQLRYMQKRRTTEIIKDGVLRFHPNDVRGWVLGEYKKRILHYNIG